MIYIEKQLENRKYTQHLNAMPLFDSQTHMHANIFIIAILVFLNFLIVIVLIIIILPNAANFM